MESPGKKSVLMSFSTRDIKVAPENALLYDNFGISNEDDRLLVEAIKKNGIQEQLVLSDDYILLSGHRRLRTAKYLGLRTVPVRLTNVNFESLSKTERLDMLRSFNFQRDKTPSEKIREELLTIDKNEAYETLKRRRLKQKWNAPESNIEMGAVKTRARITTKKFLRAVQQIIRENAEYLPLTVRRVHYLLLNNPPLRHDKKPNSLYRNDKGSYQALVSLLIRARLAGDVSMWAIEDSTRPIMLGGGFSTLEEFVTQETEGFLKGYSRDLMMGQPHHIEILVEKDGLRTIIEKIGREFCIPVTTGRGFSSLTPRQAMYRRYKRSGKNEFFLLILSDFDPDGEEIATSFARSLRDDFNIENIHPIKVAITAENVKNEDLPSDLDAKPSSSNYKKFVKQYGTKVVELDAASVGFLQGKLRNAIESVIDVAEYNAQIELEKEDAANVVAHRRTVLKAIGLK